jgi:hypothetical protein
MEFVLSLSLLIFPGDHSEEVTPVPIPNTEVKGLSGNGTILRRGGRVARCRGYNFGRLTLGVDRPFFCDQLYFAALPPDAANFADTKKYTNSVRSCEGNPPPVMRRSPFAMQIDRLSL